MASLTVSGGFNGVSGGFSQVRLKAKPNPNPNQDLELRKMTDANPETQEPFSFCSQPSTGATGQETELEETVYSLESLFLGQQLPEGKEGFLVFHFLLLIYMAFLCTELVTNVITPAYKVLAHKLHLHDEIANAMVKGIPRSSPLFFINLVVCSQRTILVIASSYGVGSASYAGNAVTTAATGVGLFFANFMTRCFIIPCMTQLDFINKSFNSLKLRYISVFRDLLFVSIGIGLLLRAMALKASSFRASQIYGSNDDAEQLCRIGEESLCCFQKLLSFEIDSAAVAEDGNSAETYSFEKLEHGIISSEEMIGFFYAVLGYVVFIYFEEKIEFMWDTFREWAGQGDSIHSELLLRKKHTENNNDFLLYFKNNIHSHQNQSKSDEKMRILSKYFLVNCPVRLLQMFIIMDEDNNQRIDFYEFIRMFAVFDLEITDQNGVDLVKFIDIHNTEQGKVSLESFTRWFVKIESSLIKEAELIFDLLDRDQSNYVLVKELLFFVEYYFNSYSNTLTMDLIHSTRLRLRINKYKFLSRKKFLYWVRYFLLHNRLLNSYSSLNGKLDPQILQFSHRFQSFLEHNMDDTSERSLELVWSVKQALVTKEDAEGISCWPFSSYDEDPGYTTILYKIGHLLKLPILFFFFVLVIPCTGKLRRLRLFGSLLWLVVANALLLGVCVVMVFLSHTICLTLNIPFELFGYFILGLLLNLGDVILYSKLIFVQEPKKSTFKLLSTLPDNYSAMVTDVLVSFPLSLYAATVFGDRHLLLSNFDTNLMTSLLVCLQTLLLLLLYFLAAGFKINGRYLVMGLVFFGCFTAQLAGLANFWQIGLMAETEATDQVYIVCANCEENLVCY